MSRKAWKVTNDKWEEIDDPLFAPKGLPDENYGDDPRLWLRLDAISYKNPMRVVNSKRLVVDVYPGRDSYSPHPYAVIIAIAGKQEIVYASNLPSLRELLEKISRAFETSC